MTADNPFGVDMGGYDSDPDEDIWGSTKLGQSLCSMEKMMTCGICKCFMGNPHYLPCNHQFCGECINRSMDGKKECPTCRLKCEPFQVRPAANLGAVIVAFKEGRKELLDLLNNTKEPEPCEVCTKRQSRKKRKSGVNESPDAGENLSRTSSRVSGQGSSSNSNGGFNGLLSSVKIVKKLPFINLNAEKNVTKVRNALNDATKLSSVKLVLDGDLKKVKSRYKNFSFIYNAQVGSLNPLSLDQVVSRVNTDEREKERNSRTDYTSKDVIANMDGSDNGFQAMIRDQKRKKMELAAAASNASNTDGNNDNGNDAEQERNNNGSSNSGNNISGMSSSSSANVNEKESRNETATGGGEKDMSFQHGKWKIALSTKLSRLFFFNTDTSVGLFKCPDELTKSFGPLAALLDSGNASTSSIDNLWKQIALANTGANANADVDADFNATEDENSTDDDSEADGNGNGEMNDFSLNRKVGDIDGEIGGDMDGDGEDDGPLDRTMDLTAESPIIESTPSSSSSMVDATAQLMHWNCSICTYRNAPEKEKCDMCMKPNPNRTKVTRSQNSVGIVNAYSSKKKSRGKI